MLQLPHCKRHSCALRAGHACRCVAVPPPPLQPPDWPAKVTARSAGGRSLAVTCYWRHNLWRSSLHWTKRWTGLNLTLRVNDRYPKLWYFVKRPYWWISALGLKCKVWKFGTHWAKSEEVIDKKQGLTGSEIHSNVNPLPCCRLARSSHIAKIGRTHTAKMQMTCFTRKHPENPLLDRSQEEGPGPPGLRLGCAPAYNDYVYQ